MDINNLIDRIATVLTAFLLVTYHMYKVKTESRNLSKSMERIENTITQFTDRTTSTLQYIDRTVSALLARIETLISLFPFK
jgi:hypothetical protein